MTSKNLYFKLMREDWKNRLWAPALIALGCFFLYPVFLVFLAGRAVRECETAELGLKWFTTEAIKWLSFENGMTVFGVVLVSLICGLSSFSYLNSKSRVDFYHSIPVRREKLFLVHYLDGILMPAIPYAVALIASVIVCAANGVDMELLCGTAASACAFHLIYYILCYTTVVIASMLTGHLVVGFFGSMVLMFYVPLAAVIVESFFNTFFLSYSYENYNGITESVSRISPVMEYIHSISCYVDGKPVWPAAGAAFLVSVILAAAALFLYRKRRSEAAGRAMAFGPSCPIVRVLITVLSGLGMGGFLWSMQNSNGWMAFGVICGSMIAHCVIESIYHFDFRKLFAQKMQLVCCVAVALAVVFSFRFDLFGYDAYLPSAQKVQYAAVDISNLNRWVSYGNVEKENDGPYTVYTYADELSGSYIAKHMQCNDLDTVLNIAAAGIEENRRLKEQWNAAGGRQMVYQEAAQQVGAAETAAQEVQPVYTMATVFYTLKSGRVVSRNYTIDMTKSYELLKELQQDAEYQSGAYPLLSAQPEQFANVRYRKSRSSGDQNLKNLTDSQRAELLHAYQQEFAALTLDTMKEEMPLGLIHFTTEEEEQAIAWWNQKENRNQAEMYPWRYSYSSDVRDEAFYPVYPSFKKTIALLEQSGISVDDSSLSDKIVSVTVRGYAPGSDEYQVITFTDPSEIRALGNMTRNERMLHYDPMYEEEDLTVEVTVADTTQKAENGDETENTYNSFFKKGEIPALVKERMGF